MLDLPASELIARSLFEMANYPKLSERGGLAKARKAQSVILNRLVGRRRAGTHPARMQDKTIEFRDLTEAIESGSDEQ